MNHRFSSSGPTLENQLTAYQNNRELIASSVEEQFPQVCFDALDIQGSADLVWCKFGVMADMGDYVESPTFTIEVNRLNDKTVVMARSEDAYFGSFNSVVDAIDTVSFRTGVPVHDFLFLG